MSPTPTKNTQVGDYELIEHIGSGGFADVWKAKHHILDQHVAIKIPIGDEAAALFRKEIETLDRFDHPHIVKVLAASITHNPPFIAMELIEGGSLRQLIKDKGGLPFDQVQELGVQILEAMAAAHKKGIVHGDLKPENVLLTKSGEARIADFGLSQKTGGDQKSLKLSASLQQSESISGTLDYMPREVRDGQQPDQRADVYAFGVMFFEMLTGRRPDIDETPSEHRKSAPALFDEVFQRCYTRYDKRFPNAQAVLKKLKKDKPAAAGPSATPKPAMAPQMMPEVTPAAPAAESAGWENIAVWVLVAVGVMALALTGRFLGGLHAAIFGASFFGALTVIMWMPSSDS